MEAEVVAIELKPILGYGSVTSASALLLPGSGSSPLLLTTCPVPVNHGVAVALRGQVLEADVVAHATVEAASEAFSCLASRGWRCGNGAEPAMRCRLQLFLLRPKHHRGSMEVTNDTLPVSFASPCDAWVGRAVAMHGAPFGARVDAGGDRTWARFHRVVMQGVVSNISSPPGLLMTDVHMADSFAGAALVLQHTNQVIALMAPSLRSSSGESVALSLAIPMAMILDTLLDSDACREQLLPAELAALPQAIGSEAASLPSEVRQGVALLWLESGSWASAIVLSAEGHLLTCAHLLTSVSWMEGQQLPGRPTARQCRGRCYVSREGEIVSMTFEADVLQIFEGCLDAALLLVRWHDQPAASLNPSLWRRQATVAELVQGLEVSAVGYGLFGPGCPWEGPAVTTGQLCKVAYSHGPPRRCAVLQSSAAVHRGCSGGALVATSGKLLGMVTTNVKQQDGSVMPHVNFILPVTLLTPICTYLDNLKVLPAEQALKRLTEELRFSSANAEEQGLWRLETETLELPSRMLARKRHALKRMDELQKEAEEEVERLERQQMNGSATRSKL